jgi:hypothetical protein
MEDFSPVNKELQSFQKRLAGAISGGFRCPPGFYGAMYAHGATAQCF